MNLYICIFLSFIFTVLILQYFFKSSKENLTNEGDAKSKTIAQEKEEKKEEEDAISSLNSSINFNKQDIGKLLTKNTNLNDQLDKLVKKIDCITAGNDSHSNAIKSKSAQLKKQKNAVTNLPTNFSPS